MVGDCAPDSVDGDCVCGNWDVGVVYGNGATNGKQLKISHFGSHALAIRKRTAQRHGFRLRVVLQVRKRSANGVIDVIPVGHCAAVEISIADPDR